MQKSERRKFCWNTFKPLQKGPQTTGGLAHILVPADNSNSKKHIQVQNKTLLDSSLLQRNIDHFCKAHGTPFTTNQITAYIGKDGCNTNSDDVLQGKVQPHLPKFVTLLLQQFHQQHKAPIEIQFTFEDMCNGFMKWRERTTTSPSGKHLGIYRALIQIIYHHDYESDQTIYDTAHTCLQIQYLLMNIAIHQCHTFHRWKTVHNFLLEKTPGVLLISKLRVIHI
jgi:hypothetical protein